MNSPSVKKNFLMSNIYQVLVLIIPFITTPYVSRVLGVESIGIYSYTTSIQTYFSMIAALGTGTYGGREIARNRDNKAKYSLLFWEIELVTLFTTAVSLLAWIIWIIGNENYKVYYIILSLNILAVLLDISWFFSGLERFAHIVIKNTAFKILGVICIFCLVKDENDLYLYVGIMAMSTLLGNASMWLYLPRYLIRINWRELRVTRHFKETVIYFVPTIAISIYTVLDKTLIGVITHNEAENGNYEQANKIISIAKAISFSALNRVMSTRISYLFSEGRIIEIKNRIAKSIDYTMFMAIGFCFGTIGVANNFVPWYFGTGYEETVVFLRMMSPLVIIIGISNCLGTQYYTPIGLRKKSAMYIIYGAVANLISNLIFIPILEGRGAILGSLIAETIISGLYLKNCDAYFTIKQLIIVAWKKFIAAVAMLIVIFSVENWSCSDVVQLLLQILLGAFAYVIVLFILRDSFVQYIINMLKKWAKIR